MNKWIISLKEKRFLIIWLGVCVLAFFLNLADIRGHIKFDEFKYHSLFSSSYDRNDSSHKYDDDFYPFTKFIEENHYQTDSNFVSYKSFNGIFNSFNLPEFIFYSILGLSIIFIPKLWK